jgi:chlorophyllide a oxygenase
MAVQGVGRYGGIKVYAVLREDGAEFAKNNNLEALFHVDDPGPRCPIKKGKFLDVNEALEVVRFDIQYCDWRARQDLLTIMLLHNKVPKFSSVSVLLSSEKHNLCFSSLHFTC